LPDASPGAPWSRSREQHGAQWLLERSGAVSELQTLIDSAAALAVPLSEAQASALLRLLDELGAWNKAYNLTAITERSAMLTHHLLDSLSVNADLVGSRIADVGTGAGFPGLPLALLNPERHFTLIDSSGKKIRFVAHAARTLGLTNIEALHKRAEDLAPGAPFETVLARALAPLPQMMQTVKGLCGPDTRVIAMKGRFPAAEIAALAGGWQLAASRAVSVPGLAAERHVLTLVAPGPSAAAPPGAAAMPAG
jgi:16S rRNA (guanine527-N7)-methyltransferase